MSIQISHLIKLGEGLLQKINEHSLYDYDNKFFWTAYNSRMSWSAVKSIRL